MAKSGGRKKKATTTKVPAVAKKSKRSTKLKVLKKAAATERKAMLLSSLETTQERSASPFGGHSLQAALEAIATAPKKKKQSPGTKTNKGKRLVLAAEQAQLETVLSHPAFKGNPTTTILDHLENTFPKR